MCRAGDDNFEGVGKGGREFRSFVTSSPPPIPLPVPRERSKERVRSISQFRNFVFLVTTSGPLWCCFLSSIFGFRKAYGGEHVSERFSVLAASCEDGRSI